MSKQTNDNIQKVQIKTDKGKNNWITKRLQNQNKCVHILSDE